MIQKTYLILCVLLLSVTTLYAQRGVPEPQWVRHIPVSTSKEYHYRVTYGEGQNYDKAYTRAFAKAIYENSCKQGIYVDVNAGIDEIERDISNKINVDERSMWLYINKVCEYYEEDAYGKIHMYILWQVGNNGKRIPDYEPFNECDKL